MTTDVNDIPLAQPFISSVLLYSQQQLAVDVLRLDAVHPVISGNKWYKLQYYVAQAKTEGKKAILTFGGAFSNHIIATAAAATAAGLQSIGIIRGEEPLALSPTLADAAGYGMQLYFIDRTVYRMKQIPDKAYQYYSPDEFFIVDEGGYGIPGMSGAKRILETIDRGRYTHFMAATGTGTMLAGIAAAASPKQGVLGISVLKNNREIEDRIKGLLDNEQHALFSIHHDYHFGGYAKMNKALFQFMNNWYEQTAIPSDFVYTGKLFFAADDLIRKNHFPAGSRLLLIHSGGLQGNRSLPKGTLIF